MYPARSKTAALLHQRDALREIVLDEGADFIFDLEITRDLVNRQYFLELRCVRAFEICLGLFNSKSFVDKFFCFVIRERLGARISSVAIQQVDDASVNFLQVLLIFVVYRPKRLGL